MQQSSNPVFSDKLVKKAKSEVESAQTMTVNGSIFKTTLLLAIVVATGAWSWSLTNNDPGIAGGLTFGASIAAFIVAMMMIFAGVGAVISSVGGVPSRLTVTVLRDSLPASSRAKTTMTCSPSLGTRVTVAKLPSSFSYDDFLET